MAAPAKASKDELNELKGDIVANPVEVAIDDKRLLPTGRRGTVLEAAFITELPKASSPGAAIKSKLASKTGN